MVACVYNPSIGEVEAGDHKFKVILDYNIIASRIAYLRKKRKKKDLMTNRTKRPLRMERRELSVSLACFPELDIVTFNPVTVSLF